jgi:hypothetical protein
MYHTPHPSHPQLFEHSNWIAHIEALSNANGILAIKSWGHMLRCEDNIKINTNPYLTPILYIYIYT